MHLEPPYNTGAVELLVDRAARLGADPTVVALYDALPTVLQSFALGRLRDYATTAPDAQRANVEDALAALEPLRHAG